MKKIKVLVIDDSALARTLLARGLSMDPDLEVVGKAQDVFTARDKIVFLKPDVLTLDIEMPKMDGLEFLKRLMPQYPLPVVIVSSLSKPGARITLDALEHGAVDYVLKPSVKTQKGLGEMIGQLTDKIKAASKVDVHHYKKVIGPPQYVKDSKWKPGYIQDGKNRNKDGSSQLQMALPPEVGKIIAIGASTGGVVAVTTLLSNFPADMPGTIVVQHMPPVFTRLFAEKLNRTVKMEVAEAKNGDCVVPGKVLVAPGGYQTRVIRSAGIYPAKNNSGCAYHIQCTKTEKVNGYCPSVEALFDSLAKNAAPNVIGVILTGMGKDGAGALLRMKKAGARTIAQDESSSVVYGMPKAALELGGAEKCVHINHMAAHIMGILYEMQRN